MWMSAQGGVPGWSGLMVLKDLTMGREEVLQEEGQCGSLHGLLHGEKNVANIVSLCEPEEEEE